MINRILIRIKVVQTMYSYLVSSDQMTLDEAKKSLQKSLEKGYELYHYLLLLPVELTELHQRRIDEGKHKYLPTEEDLNPNMKLVKNLFVKSLAENSAFRSYLKKRPITWREQTAFMRLELDRILKSDLYAKYVETEANDYKEDCRFWLNVMKDITLRDEELSDVLEDESVYWNDDLAIVGSFALKTIKLFEQHDQSPILPMYKDEEDSRFGQELFGMAVDDLDRCNSLIDKYAQAGNWDKDRIALMDRLIMCVAITETMRYPLIPASVTMNEYIEIAKYYSTPKSGIYINGILNAVINLLRQSGEIKK